MLFALLLGFLLPLVLRMNEALGRTLGLAQGSVLVHVVGGVFGILVILPFCGREWVGKVGLVPLWAWGGGIIGTGLVVVASRGLAALGTATFTAVSVAAQLLAGAILDHYGLFGAVASPVSPMKGVGIVLLILGTALVVRG